MALTRYSINQLTDNNGILGDNVTGDITAQDMRNTVWSLWKEIEETSDNYYTISSYLDGDILRFDRNDTINAFSVDLSGLNNPVPPLSDVLTVGNTTLNGQNINALNGGGQLDLRYGADNTVILSTDAGAFSGTQLYMDNQYIELSNRNTGVTRLNLLSDNVNLSSTLQLGLVGLGAVLTNFINIGNNNTVNLFNNEEKVILIGSDIDVSIESGNVYIKNVNLLGDINLDTIGVTDATTILATDASGNVVDGYNLITDITNDYKLVTHAELVTLVDTEELEEGANYLITDFQTIYVQPDFNANGSQKAYTIDSVKTGTVEPLLVKATSNSTISHEAKSILFPDDTIEYLHEVENLESLGEFTKGKIIRRKDRVGNDIPFDFRQVKFKRYETALNSGNFHEYKDNGEASDEFYIFGTYDPVNPFDYESSYSNSIGRYGYIDFKVDKGQQIINYGNIWLINTVLFGNFVDNHIQADSQNNTFAGYCEGNSFGQYLWNNLFSQLFGTTFGYYCADNNINFCYNCTFDDEAGDNTIDDVQYCTFGKSFRDNDITYAEGVKTGVYFQNNTIGNCYATTFNNDTYNNIIKNSAYDNFGEFFTNNIFTEQEVNNGVIGGGTYDHTQRSEGNTVGNYFRYNTIGFKFRNNKIGDYFGESLNGNILSDEFQDNKIGNYSNINIFGNKFKDNIINNGFSGNTIGEFFGENKIGDYFSNNDIGDWFYYNIINNYFTNNTIGDYFGSEFKGELTGNIIGNYFSFNTIGDMFGANKVGENFHFNNILGSEVQYNDFGHGFINNLIDEISTVSNFTGNKFEYNTASSVFSNGFQGNTIILSGTRFINLLPDFRYNIIKIDSGFPPGFSTTTLDFTGSTSSSHVYQMGYTKEIFKRLDGGLRLKYIDNTDATVVVNIID